MTTTMENAMQEAGIKHSITLREKIWRYVSRNMNCTTEMVADALAITAGNAGINMRELYAAGLLHRTKGRPFRYTVTAKPYTSERPLTRCVRDIERMQSTAQPSIQPVAQHTIQTTAPADTTTGRAPRDADLEKIINNLTLNSIRSLHRRLGEVLQAVDNLN